MPKLLVVEDNPVSMELVIDILNAQGLAADSAEDGEEAVNKTDMASYDLILMDIRLPGIDGIEATRIIKQKHKDVHVFAITAYAKKEDREQYLAAGFDEFVPKPLEISDFLKKLGKYCKLRENVIEYQIETQQYPAETIPCQDGSQQYQDDRQQTVVETQQYQVIGSQQRERKLTARERIEKFLDPRSFVEINMIAKHRCRDFGMDARELQSDGVVTGYGKIDGRTVFVFSQDFKEMGGSIGEMHAKKICDVIDMAIKTGSPIIGFYDSGGARIQEGIDSLSGCGQIFYRNSTASGVIPQISAIMGTCAGAAAYSPALTDFVFMVRDSRMFITGPKVIKACTGEDTTPDELGGSDIHSNISGVADFVAQNDDECLLKIRELLCFILYPDVEYPGFDDIEIDSHRVAECMVNVIPDDPLKAYDMYNIIRGVADHGYIFDIKPHFSQNIITCFARLGGHTIGIVANQPEVLAGSMDVDSSDKAAHFIRFCDSFNIPLVSFVDVPGFLPGVQQEHRGIIRHGAKMLFAYSEATVPKITVIVRKAYGGAFLAMCSKDLGADMVFALPTAEIAVMGPEGAVDIIFKNEKGEAMKQRIDEYRNKFANPYYAASRKHIDAVIEPHQIRPQLIRTLQMLLGKKEERPKRKHGNIPV